MNLISRRCLTLLLCLLLPLNALAGLAAPRMPCPMQAAGMTMTNPLQNPDCCDKQNQSDKPSCKTGQQCQTSNLLLVSLATPAAAPLTSPLLATASSAFLPTKSPNGVWRPPRN
ncbi:MAG: hypothetical protein Q8R10_02525 [Pseudomonas sp.]|uniref:hypothetical protein n=1 Tax=Pseudomonas sp. TaxID=306 RepID=UPI0027370DF8|nr:hypothetical protein [Pseudomonas sp.]MDP3845282.1 hypothetical protein [Pseudomonas sp.]